MKINLVLVVPSLDDKVVTLYFASKATWSIFIIVLSFAPITHTNAPGWTTGPQEVLSNPRTPTWPCRVKRSIVPAVTVMKSNKAEAVGIYQRLNFNACYNSFYSLVLFSCRPCCMCVCVWAWDFFPSSQDVSLFTPRFPLYPSARSNWT